MGSKDNAPYLCVPEAIAFRERLGGEEVVRTYCEKLAYQCGSYIAKYLGTEVLDNETRTLTKCCMSNVRLPISLEVVEQKARDCGIQESEVGGMVRDWISEVLAEEYNTFIQSLFFGGNWWARFSGQVYLEMRDFEWAAGVLREVCARVEGGEWVGEKVKE